MTAAPFIAFGFGSRAEAAPRVQDPGTADLLGDVGVAGALPTLALAGRAGLGSGLDLGARAVTHAGLAFSVGADLRWAATHRFGAGLLVDESFYTVEELGGIRSLRAPFGNRVAATPEILGGSTTAHGVDLDWTGGAEIGIVHLREGADRAERSVGPRLDDVWGEVRASWPREHGELYVRVRAIVPVQDDFHLFGYLPWIAIGREWAVK